MRLSNTEILKELGLNIFVDPPPRLEDFDATGFNLHLGAPLLLWPDDVPYVVDHREEHIAQAWERHGAPFDLSGGKSYKLRRGEKCLGFTQEFITLPVGHETEESKHSDTPIAGTRSFLGHLSNRSWAGRAFIRSAVDAFEVKPGTQNFVTLEIIADLEIMLYEGMPFIQIGFERVSGDIFPTNSWVHGQTTPSGGQTPRKVEFSERILQLHKEASERPHR